MESVLAFMESQSRTRVWLLVLIGTLLLGILDFRSGFEISFSFFYLFPVFVAAWLLQRSGGYFIALLSAITWLAANLLAGQRYSSAWIPIWNTLTRLGFFIVFATLLTEVRRLLEFERNLSRTDPLTGAYNRRAFYEAAAAQLALAKRNPTPFTLVYLDLDNFKLVNDQHGHKAGDELLSDLVRLLRREMRSSDIVARFGGDEFALLLPFVNEQAAHPVVSRMQTILLTSMQQQNLPVTFSIGVVTFNAAPSSVDEMVRMGDQLMYQVKNEMKNAVRYAVFPPI